MPSSIPAPRRRHLFRSSRERLIATLLLLALAVATAYGVLATVAYAQSTPGAPATAAAASVAEPSSLIVDRLSREIDALKKSQHPLLLVGAPFAALLIVALLAVAYFSRRASKVKIIWGLAEFELPEELRKAKAKVTALRKREERLIAYTGIFNTLAASLSEIASSPTQVEIRRFAGLCAEGLQQILASYKASAWLYDPAADVLRIYAGQRVSTRTIRDFALRPGKGFAGHVFETGKPLCVSDVTTQPQIFTPDPFSPQDLGAMLGVPIWGSNHQPVGVLCASHAPGPTTFEPTDTAFASLYADLISVALHLARLGNVELWRDLDYRPFGKNDPCP